MNPFRQMSWCAILIPVLFWAVSSCFAVPLDSLHVTALATSGNTVYAGTSDGTLAWSSDTGKTWHMQSVGLCTASTAGAKQIFDIKILRDTVYLATYCGVFQSPAAALHWKDVSTGITDLRITTLHFYNGNLFAGGFDGAYCFSPAGGGWKKLTIDAAVSASSGDLWCRAFAHTGSTLIAAYNTGVYTSPDGGDSWKNVSNSTVAVPDSVKTRFGTFYDTVRFIEYLGASGSTITAAGFDGSVFVSTNLGASWTLSRPGCPWCDMIMMSGFFCDSVSAFYAGTYTRIDVSHDGGLHWSASGNTQFSPPTVFTRFGDLMVAGTYQGVFFSADEFKTVSRSIVALRADSFRKPTVRPSQRLVSLEVFNLQGRRITEYGTSLAAGGHTAAGIVIAKLRFENGRCVTTTVNLSAQNKTPRLFLNAGQ